MPQWMPISLILAAVVFGGCAGLLLIAHSERSTTALDADLARVRTQIEAADEENAIYQGGVIKALITLRREILLSTEAMPDQKRRSLVRRIDLEYVIQGKMQSGADAKTLSNIEADLASAQTKLSADEAEAQRYSGGLIKVMSLTTVATDRLTIAQILLALYSQKYGLTAPITLNGQANANKSDQPQTGRVVPDSEALY